jgi:anti-sigma factor RsiW
MTDRFSNTGAFAVPRPDDDADREVRHQVLATLLGAYADGEVPTETASQIDAHLLGCVRCRRELDVHRALRLRLEREPIRAASAALRDRIVAGMTAESIAPAVVMAAPTPGFAWRALSMRTRLLLGVVGLVVAGSGTWLVRSVQRAAPAPVTVVALPALTLFGEVVDDYRRVTATDLPGRSRDLATVRAAMPFPVNALSSSELRLIGAWTTDLRGDPAAVLAYRWNDKLVLQYVVSEQLLFRPADVRRAFANGHHLGAQAGAQSVMAWPATASGELLVADLSLAELAGLRATVAGR